MSSINIHILTSKSIQSDNSINKSYNGHIMDKSRCKYSDCAILFRSTSRTHHVGQHHSKKFYFVFRRVLLMEYMLLILLVFCVVPFCLVLRCSVLCAQCCLWLWIVHYLLCLHVSCLSSLLTVDLKECLTYESSV